MEERTYDTVVKTLADKIEMLEWQLRYANEENGKLKKELLAVKEMKGEKENA